MADLNVEPKSNRPWWLWLLLAALAIIVIIFLMRGCDDDEDRITESEATTTATTTESTTATDADWDNIDRDVPAASYQEITDKDVTVRGSDAYAIYSLDETILFDTESKELRSGATQKLQQIAASLNQRYPDGQIRVYGFSDARGSANYNQELSEQRAEAVRNWFVEHGDLDDDRISTHPVGEGQPVASNETAQGRQQNRRVEIVARRAN